MQYAKRKAFQKHISLFLGKTEVGFYAPKMKKTIQTVTNEKCKNQPLMAGGCISAHGMGDLHIYKPVPLMQRLMFEFWRHAAVKTTTFHRNSMSISAGQCQASFYMSYNSVASQALSACV